MENTIIRSNNIIELNPKYDKDNYIQTINQLTKRIVDLEKRVIDITITKVTLPCREGYMITKMEDILYLESNGSYTNLYNVSGKKVLISKNLKTLSKAFPTHRFIRTHQRFLINSDFIKKLVKQSSAYILLENNMQIPISRGKKEDVYGWFSNLYF